MARKVVDLTGKLGLGEKPQIVVGDVTLTVNDSARDVLQVLSLTQDMTPANVLKACDLLFDKDSRKALNGLDLSMGAMVKVMETAIGLIMGEDGDGGNAETPATT